MQLRPAAQQLERQLDQLRFDAVAELVVVQVAAEREHPLVLREAAARPARLRSRRASVVLPEPGSPQVSGVSAST